jgi:hypothetical protein
MVYDSGRGRVVLFGGLDPARNALDDLWEWDGAHWAPVAPASRPPGRHGHAMAYDARRGRTVVFGGTGADGVQRNDTWEWDGQVWWPATPTGDLPLPRRNHGLAYDPTSAHTVLFGGDRQSLSDPLMDLDTWEWDGQSWTRVYFSNDLGITCNGGPCVRPEGGAHVALAYHPPLGGVVAYGGTVWDHVPYMGPDTPDAERPDHEAQELWLWRDGRWIKLVADGAWPSAAAYEYFPANSLYPTESENVHHWGMTFDACRGRLVLFRHDPIFSGARVNEAVALFSPNTPPVLEAPAERQVYPGRSLTFDVTGSDADQDVLTFSNGPLPDGATVYGATSQGTDGLSFSWPSPVAGDYSVEFRVSDGLATTTRVVPIHVGDITYAGIPTGAIDSSASADFSLNQIEDCPDYRHCTKADGSSFVGQYLEGSAPGHVTCRLQGHNPGELSLQCAFSVIANPDHYGDSLGQLGPYSDTLPLTEDQELRHTFNDSPTTYVVFWTAALAANPDGTVALNVTTEIDVGNAYLKWYGSAGLRLSFP